VSIFFSFALNPVREVEKRYVKMEVGRV
jgi:hypothetical protein